MSSPQPQLSPVDQNELLDQIAVGLTRTLPSNWQRVVFRYRHLGRTSEVDSGVKFADGSVGSCPLDQETGRLVQRLRKGMYAEGLGTWFALQLLVDPPGRYQVRYEWNEYPSFHEAPGPEQYAVEQSRFPRAEHSRPEWYSRGLAAAPPA